LQVLAHADLAVYNTLDKPDVVVPTEKTAKLSGNKVILTFDKTSFTVVHIPLKKISGPEPGYTDTKSPKLCFAASGFSCDGNCVYGWEEWRILFPDSH
jgi:hypothetical protein